jgi:quercetin dioxygenase-like cupin family protein
MTTTTKTAKRDVITTADAGEARWWWGNLAVIRVTSEQTGGSLAVVEVTIGPGKMAPPHVHHREEETFWVLEGSLTFQIGDDEVEAAAGDVVVGPRDVPHRFRAGDDGARMLLLMSPGGLEGLVREQSVPATSRTLPPAGGPPPDLAKAKEIAARYHCELFV